MKRMLTQIEFRQIAHFVPAARGSIQAHFSRLFSGHPDSFRVEPLAQADECPCRGSQCPRVTLGLTVAGTPLVRRRSWSDLPGRSLTVELKLDGYRRASPWRQLPATNPRRRPARRAGPTPPRQTRRQARSDGRSFKILSRSGLLQSDLAVPKKDLKQVLSA